MSEYMRSGMRTPNRKGKPFRPTGNSPSGGTSRAVSYSSFLFYIGKYSTLHSRCQSLAGRMNVNNYRLFIHKLQHICKLPPRGRVSNAYLCKFIFERYCIIIQIGV